MPAHEAKTELSEGQIILRLLRVGVRHGARSLQVFLIQALLLVMTMAGLRFAGTAVDVIRHALDTTSPPISWPLDYTPPAGLSVAQQLWGLAAGVVLTASFRSLLNYAYTIGIARLVHAEMVPEFRTRLFNKLQRLSFRFFDANATGAIINRVTRDVQLLRSFVDGVLVQGAVLLLALGIFLSYMLSTHVRLTIVSLSLTPLLYVVTHRFSAWAQPAYNENRVLSDNMVRTMAESIEGVLVTKVFGREREQVERFADKSQAVREQQLEIFKRVSRFSPTINLLTQLNVLVLLVYGGYLVAERQITLGELVVFAGLLQQFASRAAAMSGIVNTLQQSMSGARRVFEVLDAPLEVREPVQPRQSSPFVGRLRFERMSFGYQGQRPVLKDITLTVEPGECVGILGPTGAGKSTLLSLIARFYDPTEGRIAIDGIDLREWDLDLLRRRIGIVFQESLLFRDTIFNNIAYGKPQATAAEVQRAAVLARAHEFIERLPHGFDSVVSENGANLSGGQRQRIAIARALLLDPPFLLFDDPTTAIDPESERDVLLGIRGASRGRTTLIVSNRLGALKLTDRVIVLDSGRLVQSGRHSDLLEEPGLYRRAADLQLVDNETLGVLRQLGALP